MAKIASGRKRRPPPAKGPGRNVAHKFANGKIPDKSKWNPAFIEIAKHMVKVENASDHEIAQALGIHRTTLYVWKRQIPMFRKAFLRGEAERIEMVERALEQRATGYAQKATKIFQHQGKVITKDYEEVFAPDVGAIKLFLQANKPEKYGDKLELGGDASRPISFVIKGLDPKGSEAAKK